MHMTHTTDKQMQQMQLKKLPRHTTHRNYSERPLREGDCLILGHPTNRILNSSSVHSSCVTKNTDGNISETKRATRDPPMSKQIQIKRKNVQTYAIFLKSKGSSYQICDTHRPHQDHIQTASRPHPDCIQTASRSHPDRV